MEYGAPSSDSRIPPQISTDFDLQNLEPLLFNVLDNSSQNLHLSHDFQPPNIIQQNPNENSNGYIPKQIYDVGHIQLNENYQNYGSCQDFESSCPYSPSELPSLLGESYIEDSSNLSHDALCKPTINSFVEDPYFEKNNNTSNSNIQPRMKNCGGGTSETEISYTKSFEHKSQYETSMGAFSGVHSSGQSGYTLKSNTGPWMNNGRGGNGPNGTNHRSFESTFKVPTNVENGYTSKSNMEALMNNGGGNGYSDTNYTTRLQNTMMSPKINPTLYSSKQHLVNNSLPNFASRNNEAIGSSMEAFPKVHSSDENGYTLKTNMEKWSNNGGGGNEYHHMNYPARFENTMMSPQINATLYSSKQPLVNNPMANFALKNNKAFGSCTKACSRVHSSEENGYTWKSNMGPWSNNGGVGIGYNATNYTSRFENTMMSPQINPTLYSSKQPLVNNAFDNFAMRNIEPIGTSMEAVSRVHSSEENGYTLKSNLEPYRNNGGQGSGCSDTNYTTKYETTMINPQINHALQNSNQPLVYNPSPYFGIRNNEESMTPLSSSQQRIKRSTWAAFEAMMEKLKKKSSIDHQNSLPNSSGDHSRNENNLPNASPLYGGIERPTNSNIPPRPNAQVNSPPRPKAQANTKDGAFQYQTGKNLKRKK